METTKMNVSGMKCPHCAATVEELVKGVKGVNHAVADLENHCVTITYDAQATSPERIAETVNAAGRYTITL